MSCAYSWDFWKRFKPEKAYFCNCIRCNKLHIFSQQTAKAKGLLYVCSGCGTLNAMKEGDLI